MAPHPFRSFRTDLLSLRIVRRAVPAGATDWCAHLHPVLRRIYAARGVSSAQDLDVSLERLLPVGSLEGVSAAVELLLKHRTGRILVVGDFDADGATSTAVMVRALKGWGFAHVDFLVPNRFKFGYGLTPEIVALAAERSPSLIVTVDNGISSLAGVAACKKQGIEVLITDHHLAGHDLPDADVIVNPNVKTSRFASRCLAGVGVAFYVMAALKRALDAQGLTKASWGAAELLDLVALGTVADVVPLDANNRVLVAQGLKRIRAGRCARGISALLTVAGKFPHDLVAADLGYGVAPRLNAAGRIDDMSIGIQCLLTDDTAEALRLAQQLDTLNQERRSIEAKMQREALATVRGIKDPALADVTRHGLCLYDPSWHQGVVGLVAGRIKERLRRPVIAFANAGEGLLRGSARSVPGIHIRDVLDAIAARQPDLISKFGGHAMAAGLTLERDKLEALTAAFDAEVKNWAQYASLADAVETDGELSTQDIAIETAEALRAGGPWGQAFPEPCFDGVFQIIRSRIVGSKHLKMSVEVPQQRRTFDAIAFNHIQDENDAQQLPTGPQHLVYRLDINEYQGERRLQLLVEHVLPPQ